MKVGIIGVGAIAESHVGAIKSVPGLELSAVCRRNSKKLKEFTGRYGGEPYTDWHDLVKSGVNIVVISTPHYLHEPIALEAIGAGCHVLIEKPMATTVEGCLKIIQAAQKKRVKLIIADLEYLSDRILKAREIVISGVLGKPIMAISINYRRYFTPERLGWFLEKEKSGGGMLLNLGVHRLAMFRSVLGGREIAVTARTGCYQKGVDVEGDGQIFIEYDTSTSAVIQECGYFNAPEILKNTTHFTFTNGILGFEQKGVWVCDGNQEITHYDTHDYPGGPYQPFFEEMVRSIEEDREPYPSGIEGLLDVRTILAAYRSSQEKRRVELTGKEWGEYVTGQI